MLEKMMDQQFMLYVLAGVSAVALLQKIIVSLLYRHLKKETDALPTVNDRWMKQLKLKFENTYKVNNQMTDVGVFVDRQVAKVKFFKAGLHGLNTFYRKAQLVCLLLGGFSYVVAARAGKTTGDCNVFFLMGILAAVFIQLLDNLSGNVRSAELVKLNITDYFENILLPKLGQERGICIRLCGGVQGRIPGDGSCGGDGPFGREGKPPVKEGCEASAERGNCGCGYPEKAVGNIGKQAFQRRGRPHCKGCSEGIFNLIFLAI